MASSSTTPLPQTLTHRLVNLSLRMRFALLLGTMAGFTFVLFFFFARYATEQIEHEFEQRSQLLAGMLGTESEFALLMHDAEGLQETLTWALDQQHILAGAFLNAHDSILAEVALTEIATANRQRGDEALQWSETPDGHPILLVHQKIGGDAADRRTAGTVLLAVPADDLQQKRRASLVLSLLAPLFIIALAGVILHLVGRTVIKPVEILRNAAKAFEAGDMSARAPIQQHDEIGELAASINAMMAASEQNILAIQEHTEHAGEARQQAEVLQQEAEAERAYLQEQFERISEVIVAVRGGDLTKRLVVEHEDAVGTLMTQINQMVEDLEALIREVLVASNELAQAAAHVATSSERMSTGVQNQSNQTMEVASAIEEMAATVAESSQHAATANATAERAAQLANSGETIFRDNTASMHRIATIVRNSTEQVTSLGRSSAQIGEIIQVISDIADQTNLLALNAAIEAARAGDQGRGFAVVADEVRKLAERTTSATQEIADMITVIQEKTDDVVASMSRGNKEVETGLHLSDEAARSLGQIIESINNMALMIGQIATSSEEQAATSAEISRHVDGILSVALEVSGATSGLTQTAEGVNHQASLLRGLVARFQTHRTASAKANETAAVANAA